MAHQSAGPAQLVLLASVARRYYLDGRSKVEIGQEFGLSRFKVARLLDTARDSGLVHIEIRHEGIVDLDLSARFRETFGLRHAIVVDAPDDPVHLRQQLGRAAGELLAEVMTSQDVLGLAWARSVSAMGSALPPLPAVPVVQLTGALSLPDGGNSSIDLVRDVARVTGGPAYVFYAPFIVSDTATARALRRQPEIARAFSQLPRVTKAVAALGRWVPGESTLHDAADERDQRALQELGVCAEISGVFLTADGEPVTTELGERMIGVDAEQMRAIPEVIVIAYGTAKAAALGAALRSGLVGGLVTHTALARALLDAQEQAGERTSVSA
jgi:DNA-binding transcriptional regulator LsrR (DeoR family)